MVCGIDTFKIDFGTGNMDSHNVTGYSNGEVGACGHDSKEHKHRTMEHYFHGYSSLLVDQYA